MVVNKSIQIINLKSSITQTKLLKILEDTYKRKLITKKTQHFLMLLFFYLTKCNTNMRTVKV